MFKIRIISVLDEIWFQILGATQRYDSKIIKNKHFEEENYILLLKFNSASNIYISFTANQY